jgi:signal transduction histidine kinase
MKSELHKSAGSMVDGALICPVFLPQAVQRPSQLSFLPDQALPGVKVKSCLENWRQQNHRAAQLSGRLFQSSLSTPPELESAANQTPADPGVKVAAGGALRRIERIICSGRATLRGLFSSLMTTGGLEQALSEMIGEFQPTGTPCRAFVVGKPRMLKPEIQEQICLIGREAFVNALRHSDATLIEVEIEYQCRGLRLLIRDNGRGIDPEVVRSSRNSRWGLLQMEERARSLGAQLRIWTRRGLGTEVEVSVPAAFVSDAAA